MTTKDLLLLIGLCIEEDMTISKDAATILPKEIIDLIPTKVVVKV